MENKLTPYDLRVGNLVNGIYEDENTGEQVYSQCTVLVLDTVTGNYPIWVESKDNQEADFFEWFEGIPLSEEWLLRLGHKKRVHDKNNVEYTKGRFSVWFIEGNLQVIKFGIQRLDHTFINSLHRYQNVTFALTGTELIIETQNKQ